MLSIGLMRPQVDFDEQFISRKRPAIQRMSFPFFVPGADGKTVVMSNRNHRNHENVSLQNLERTGQENLRQMRSIRYLLQRVKQFQGQLR